MQFTRKRRHEQHWAGHELSSFPVQQPLVEERLRREMEGTHAGLRQHVNGPLRGTTSRSENHSTCLKTVHASVSEAWVPSETRKSALIVRSEAENEVQLASACYGDLH